jgi:hypothetical protein
LANKQKAKHKRGNKQILDHRLCVETLFLAKKKEELIFFYEIEKTTPL